MTREEYNRLNELDSKIIWNSTERWSDLPPLTEEEQKEHSDLIWRLLSGEDVED